MSFLQDKIYKLKGKIMHYDWGGHDFIPQWMGIKNDEKIPFAEYWMGAHQSASSEIETKNGSLSLFNLLSDNPEVIIGQKIYNQYQELPYLFKIEDVRQMLSIQVHPTKEEAETGFRLEEEQGINLNAAQRTYKDKNHKPEIMVAISEFWLLHGFKSPDEIRKTLIETPELKRLLPFFEKDDYKNLYSHVMETSITNINYILLPLIKRELNRKKENKLTKNDPGWWVAEFYQNSKIKNADRGIFSLYFLNLLKVNPGEAVFQDAGLLHAYLEGQAMELMANSDNVIRGGLTKKYINIPELLKQIKYSPVNPVLIEGKKQPSGAINFACPSKDFGIDKIELQKGESYSFNSNSLEIIAILEGSLTINAKNELKAEKGEVLAVFTNTKYNISTDDKLIAFKAFVP